ncbi:hypothetical protein RB195_014831 [Necator americanus]|uniref:Uncharacterized protein n=1 Tax=Necator americanus TaxID=51031 RepID=A0ABR1E321_NECAM
MSLRHVPHVEEDNGETGHTAQQRVWPVLSSFALSCCVRAVASCLMHFYAYSSSPSSSSSDDDCLSTDASPTKLLAIAIQKRHFVILMMVSPPASGAARTRTRIPSASMTSLFVSMAVRWSIEIRNVYPSD